MSKKTHEEQSSHDSSRRKFIKGAAYVAPVVITMAAKPAFASAGSTGGTTTPPRPQI